MKVKKSFVIPVDRELNKGGFYLKEIQVYEVLDGTGSHVVSAFTFAPWKKKLNELIKNLLGDSLDYGFMTVEVEGVEGFFKHKMLTFEEWASLCIYTENLDRGTEAWIIGQKLYSVFCVVPEFFKWHEKAKDTICCDRKKVEGFEEVDQRTKTEIPKTEKQLSRIYSLAGKLDKVSISKEDKEFLITMLMNYRKVINLGKRISDFEYLSKDVLKFDRLIKKLRLDLS